MVLGPPGLLAGALQGLCPGLQPEGTQIWCSRQSPSPLRPAARLPGAPCGRSDTLPAAHASFLLQLRPGSSRRGCPAPHPPRGAVPSWDPLPACSSLGPVRGWLSLPPSLPGARRPLCTCTEPSSPAGLPTSPKLLPTGSCAPQGGAVSDGGRGAREGGGQPPLQTCLDGEGAGGLRGAQRAPCGTQVDRHPGDGRAAQGSPGHTISLSRAISHGVRGPGRGHRVPCPGLSALQHRPFTEGDGTQLEKHVWAGTSTRTPYTRGS